MDTEQCGSFYGRVLEGRPRIVLLTIHGIRMIKKTGIMLNKECSGHIMLLRKELFQKAEEILRKAYTLLITRYKKTTCISKSKFRWAILNTINLAYIVIILIL